MAFGKPVEGTGAVEEGDVAGGDENGDRDGSPTGDETGDRDGSSARDGVGVICGDDAGDWDDSGDGDGAKAGACNGE